jgi:hypothetical protein
VGLYGHMSTVQWTHDGQLAQRVGASERTLRRAVAEGSIGRILEDQAKANGSEVATLER